MSDEEADEMGIAQLRSDIRNSGSSYLPGLEFQLVNVFEALIRADMEGRRQTLESIDVQRRQLADEEMTAQALADRAQEIQDRIQTQDPLALKNAYRELFEAVWVHPSPKDGTVQLNFTLRGHQASPVITREEKSGVGEQMVGPPGLEPGVRRL